MIHCDVVVQETCSVELYTTDGTALPEDETLLKGMARSSLPEPDSDWAFEELVWDSKTAVVLWFIKGD